MLRAIFLSLALSFVLPAQAKLTRDPADLLVEVTNFDGQWVYLKDKSGQKYKYPRKKFQHKKIKIHESFMIHKEGVKAFKIKDKKEKKTKPRQG